MPIIKAPREVAQRKAGQRRKSMKHALKNVAAGCAAVALLAGASSGAANAYYLGYGNGDPGNWGFWTEQQGGPHKAKAHVHHAAASHHHAALKREKRQS
jgi:hypothetical protein